MSLFRLIAKLGIDSTEFNAGLKQAEGTVASSMKSIGTYIAGAFSVSAVAAFAAHVAKAAGDIGDLADQLQITTDQVQALQRAADLSGVSFDKYANALGKLRKLRADARAGDATAISAFKKTGLNPNSDEFTLLQQIGGLPDEKAFEILDAKSAKLKNSLQSLADVPKVQLISDEDVQTLDRAGDKLGEIKREVIATAAAVEAAAIRSVESRGAGGALEDVSGTAFGPAGRFVARLFSRRAGLRNETPEDQATFPGLPVPSRINPRSTGEEFGPTDGEATVQMLNRARQSGSGQFSTMEDLIRGSKFTPINMGDRANVGGFFGPNTGLNAKLARLGTNVEKMTKAMEEVKIALTTQNTN